MWYYAQNNAPVGPITFDDLAGRIRTGVVTPETLVFTTGMTQWQAAKDTPQLAALFAGAASPPRLRQPPRRRRRSAAARTNSRTASSARTCSSWRSNSIRARPPWPRPAA